MNNVGYGVECPDYFAESPQEVSCEEVWHHCVLLCRQLHTWFEDCFISSWPDEGWMWSSWVALKTNCRKWPMRSVSWLPLCIFTLSHTPSLPLLLPLPSPLHSLTLLSFFSSSYSLAPHLIFSSPPYTPSHSSHTLPPPLSEEKYDCEVCIIPVDFSEGHDIYPRIAEELQDLDIGVIGKVASVSSTIL